MNSPKLSFFIFFLFFSGISFSQDDFINQGKPEIDGNKLVISYDFLTKNSSDIFYIWVEIENSNGEKIKTKSFSGDIGSNQKAGMNKKIIWAPEQDSIYLDEEITITVIAEKYLNKGSIIIRSALFPGWGQTKINNRKPWWLAGAAFYGTLAGSYIFNQKYLKSYDSYKAEDEDPVRRNELLNKTQKQLNSSIGLLYSAASIWAINMIWVAVFPDRNKPLKNANVSFSPSPSIQDKGFFISLRLDFN
jgi:hypothetical protein